MYALGAIKNEPDARDIQLTQIQAPVLLPAKYITDISWIPVLNQQQIGACVGHAQALVHIYNEYKENKNIVKCSPRFLYALAKKIDGNPTQQGTQPRVVAGIQSDKGDATEDFCLNDTSLSHVDYINVIETEDMDKNAAIYKTAGYTTVGVDKDSLKQAIFQNGLVPITISVGGFSNPIPRGNIGLHRVCIYGYDGDRFFYRNSWGQSWGDNGNGYFDWGNQDVIDPMVFVDVPDPVLKQAQAGYKYFSPATDPLMVGLLPALMQKLDQARGIAGVAFKITSGFRTPAQNKAAGGVYNSAHLTGEAVDIACSDSFNRYKIVSAAYQVGFKRIEVCPSHIHMDISSTLPQNVLVLSQNG